MLLVDAHLDLSMNALEWNRDLRLPVEAIRAREAGLTDKPDRGRGTVSLPELRRGRIGLVVATQIARYVAPGNPLPGWHSAEQAWAQTQGQLAWYREMERAGEMRAITDLASLEAHLAAWMAPGGDVQALPIGYIRSLEGADSLVTVDYLERAVRDGLRAVGPAHYGPGRYAPGTHTSGRLEAQGPALLAAMERLGVILDVTHLSDDSLWQALDLFGGAVWASHHNARALVDDQRQLPDDQIKAIVARGAVIGASCDAWMIVPGWVRGRSTPQSTGCTFERLADHVVHICELAGSTRHVCIGSDLDGAFGTEQTPADLDTCVDLHRLCDVLAARGFSEDDLEGFRWRNVVEFLRAHWAGREWIA
ncbi:peptidase [Luteitalea sp. TBR-22]|uniref:dipeptidase n=1 Tax=Luteitalea sp. TBR-22 TaxID=2802971 RepID=UPI001AF1C928|nr:membrane dipeptidase [Luteitalea sp. TBR-22]BCS33450.1 peptidase [Luteitalea sp. TBR-22]